MKILSTVCSIVLLGTIFSGVSMAMDGAEGEVQRPRAQKLLSINGYQRPAGIGKNLSSYALNCDDLEVRIEGDVMDRVAGKNPASDSSDEDADWGLSSFLRDLGKPRIYSHGVYSVEEGVAEIVGRGDSTQRSPQHVRIVNTIISTLGVEAIEEQRGPMVRPALSILSLCPNLEGLSLRCLNIDRRGIQALQETSKLSFLKMLDIRHAQMGDEEVAMLLAAPLPVLKHLDLGHNKITGVSFSGASLPALETLDLWDNEVGNEGLRAITESLSPSLRTLSLGANTINSDGLRTARWGDRNLEMLLLDCNPIQDEGAHILADRGYLPTLKFLGLAYSKIGIEGLTALHTRLSTKMITVAGAEISAEEKRLFLRAPNLFLGTGIRHHSYNGRVFTLGEMAAEYPHIKF